MQASMVNQLADAASLATYITAYGYQEKLWN